MRETDWKDIAEFVGIAAIVASLIFVGLEMRQSQEIAIADQYQARAEIALDNWRDRKDNAISVRRVGGRELESHGFPGYLDEDASLEEIGTDLLDVRMTFLIYDNLHFQYESGFLTEESWDSHVRTMRGFLSRPRFQHYVYEHKGGFRTSYWDLCDHLVRQQ
jgi:hypothetical protein